MLNKSLKIKGIKKELGSFSIHDSSSFGLNFLSSYFVIKLKSTIK